MLESQLPSSSFQNNRQAFIKAKSKLFAENKRLTHNALEKGRGTKDYLESSMAEHDYSRFDYSLVSYLGDPLCAR